MVTGLQGSMLAIALVSEEVKHPREVSNSNATQSGYVLWKGIVISSNESV